jgi:hypothetical protein
MNIRFSEIDTEVPNQPGIYEIHTDTGVALKVGIASNLRKRLRQHRASLQSCLPLKKPDGDRSDPNQVQSKRSILAKHLYYDTSIAPGIDLRLQLERRLFLEQKCHIVFTVAETIAQAREWERQREGSGVYRYTGTVVKR